MRGLEERPIVEPHDDLERAVLDRELDVAPAGAGRAVRGRTGQGAIQLGHILTRAADMVENLRCELAQERFGHVPAGELEREIERLTWHVCEIL